MITSLSSNSEHFSVNEILKHNSIASLNSLQVNGIHDGLLEYQNFLIALPTGSGKTLLTIIKSEEILRRNQKVIYLTPTRALNNQIYNEYRNYFSHTYYIHGKMKSSKVSEAVRNFQVLVSTFEKFEIEFRKCPHLLENVGLIIIDEIHLISDNYRGPTYELMISLLLYLQEQDKWTGSILGLSGSIHNPDLIASWMKAGYSYCKERMNPYEAYVVDINVGNNELLLYSKKNEESEFRTDSISLDKELSEDYSGFNTEKLSFNISEKFLSTIITCLRMIKAQHRVLILCSTQLETEVLNHYMLQTIEINNWPKINSLYHHAGAPKKHKLRVELLCKEGVVDCIFATTTFAMGVDFPFDAVILTFRSLYDKLYNWKDNDIQLNEKLSIHQILLMQQIIGRTGHRPGSAALVYCIGETLDEGSDIYHKAIEQAPGLVSNFNSYLGKIKFQQFLNNGCVAGWFDNFQDLLDFSKLLYFMSSQKNDQSKELDRVPSSIRNNILIDEINNFIVNPLISIKYQDIMIDNKILMLRHLIEEANLQELEIFVNPAMCVISKMNVSPKQILDFLDEFNRLFTNDLIRIVDIAGIVKLIVKTDPKLIIEIAKLKRTFIRGKYDDIDIQQLNKVLSPLRQIDYYLSMDSTIIKPNKSELQFLIKVRSLLQGFQQVINEQLSDEYLFSNKTLKIIPYLNLQISLAHSHFDKIIRLNSV